jgi:filamentous hemagglutinin family protein
MKWRWRHTAASAVACFGLLALSTAGHAQITTDGSLGLASSLAGPNHVIDSALGQIRGNNLFHSFGQFNVQTGESATFTGPFTIGNILSRVTGGNPSVIQGLIDSRTAMPTANFFLLNPNGVMVGPGATLNVGGSFHVSTADYIRFADGAQFFARLSPTSTLSVAAPTAFGFLSASPAPVSIDGADLGVALAVDPGQTLSVVGGPVTIRTATLQAPGGRVQIAAAAGTGELPIGNIGAGSVPGFGPVNISGGSIIDATGDPGGTVVIRGGRIMIDGVGTTVSTGTLGDTDPPTTVGIDIRGQEQVVVSGGAIIQSFALAGGRGGDISITAGNGSTDGSVEVSGTSAIFSQTGGRGRGGDVSLLAGLVSVDDAGIATASTSSQGPGNEGVGGDVTLKGATVTLANGASIQSINQNTTLEGRGGNITVSGTNSVSISGQNAFATLSNITSTTGPVGDGGRIEVKGGSLTMAGGAFISSTAQFTDLGGAGGPIVIDVGNLSLTGGAVINTVVTDASAVPGVLPFLGGNVTVSATGTAVISGVFGGIFSSGFAAPPGDITLQVGSLHLLDKAQIQGGSTADPNSRSGRVTVAANDSILIAGGAGISSQALNSDVGPVAVSAKSLTIDGGFISTGTFGAGRAGNISIDAGALTLTNGGQITSGSAEGSGPGGNVTIKATQSVTISGSAPASVLPEPFDELITETASGIFSTSPPVNPSANPAGSIAVTTQTLSLAGGGKISAATEGPGAAGSIAVSAGNVSISGPATGLFSTATAEGDAGQITLSGSNVSLSNQGQISTATAGVGRGGIVVVDASGSLSVDSNAGLFSTAQGTGAAGSITVSSPTVSMTQGGKISVATEGDGPGGNMALNAGTLTLTSAARLDSSTTGAGPGGSIAVTAGSTSVSGPGTGLFSTATSTGDAGQITVSGSSVSLTNQGQISASASGAGRAGTIAIDAGSLSLAGGASLLSNTSGTGPGGDINITAGDVSLQGGSTISANSTGSAQALAGSINVVFGNTLSLEGGSAITTTSLLADGGNISVTSTGSTLSLFDSQITTSVQSGVGQGGNITLGSDLHALDFLIMSDGQIRADAFGGPGGNIRVFADTFLSSGSIISASSALSAPGTIAIQAQFTDLNSALVQLPADVLQATILLRASCAARLAEGKTSSLVVAGREGVPPEPDGLLASPLVLDGWTASERTAMETPTAPLLTLRWPTPLACP